MEHWYKYAILSVCPNKIRGEVVNIGLIIISPDGDIDIQLSRNLNKARALDGNLTDQKIITLTDSIPMFAVSANNVKEKVALINMACKGNIRCSQFGEFSLSSTKDYSQKVLSLLDLLVNSIRKTRETKTQRISTKMRTLFSDKSLLGSKDDIDNHLVVPNYPIDDKQLFKADFALKNGAMHITQTIDLDTSDSGPKYAQAALDALTLDKARDVFGDKTQRYVVYSASSNRAEEMAPQLYLLDEHATGMFNLKSKEEINTYLALIETAIDSRNLHS